MLPEIGELVFSLVVGYMGALEFLYVVRHLYHWSFKHNPGLRNMTDDAATLEKLQDQLKSAITEANGKEPNGFKAMKDGVLYKDGFRVDPDQEAIDKLKEKVRNQEKNAERQREIEAELARQRKIEQETKKQLRAAEEELQRIEEEKKRKAEEEQRRLAEEAQRQQEIEEENTRRLLAAEREREESERQRELEENARRLLEAEREREERQRQQEIEEENARKILEAEREREERQRQQELDEENVRKLLQAEREREERQREEELFELEREREEKERIQEIEDQKIIERLLEAERQREEQEEQENVRKLLDAENERIERQRQQELEDEAEMLRVQEEESRHRIEEEENYRRLIQMERDMEEREREAEEERKALMEHAAALERETAEHLLAAEREAIEKQRQIEENEENMRKLLEAERELELKKQEMEEEAENLRRLIEAEREMEERQRLVDEEALETFRTAEDEVELRQALDTQDRDIHTGPIQTVKTQYGQTSGDAIKSKSILFPGMSEESSSLEPYSSQRSSFSTQQSSDTVLPELHFDEYERQAPDGGEDMPSLQYSDDYLRSLDGIKNKPLVREDGSGRRRAFKKRRSGSGSSTSSRESRTSREEEVKMFTSLEEEELENIRKGDSEYEAIKYTSEPNLKVTRQHRRHKRSPVKDVKRDPVDATKGSLEMLDEEESNPWGEVKPEHYKDTEFWKRERNLSIDEELEEADAKQLVQSSTPSVKNVPKMSSFEEATKSQNEEAISTLQKQRTKDTDQIKEQEEEDGTKNVSKTADARQSPAGGNTSLASASASAFASDSASPNAISSESETSQKSGNTTARTPSPNEKGLRRSPRVDEMKSYKEKWKSEDRKARAGVGQYPAIEIESASDEELMQDDEPPEEEYLMEGISDFYDFNASINPSRSRSRTRSRSVSPAVNRSVSPHRHRSLSLQNLSHIPDTSKSRSPSPDPASYKFFHQRLLPSLQAADEQLRRGKQDFADLSDFYDFNSKLSRQVPSTGATTRRSNEVHRTSVDYVMEDLENEELRRKGNGIQQTPETQEYERSISADWRDIQRIKDDLRSGAFKRSTYVGESMDFSDQYEHLREEAKHFRRSRSKSRSPGYDVGEMTTKMLARQQLQNQILEDLTKTAQNSEDFSRDMTKSYVDRNRRASDTMLIQKPEILFQIQDLIQETDENADELYELEADEYHHFRRFSLNQELPVEQYPDDFVSIDQIEVKSLGDFRMWTSSSREDEPREDSRNQAPSEDIIEEPYDSGSDDERQTVVEVEDEIDEDIWDYNERPEESHNEQSECEEADREADRYASRQAEDWQSVENATAVTVDEDSFQINQIYDEAIKNRKQSGILRDYDSILQGIQISDEDRVIEEVLQAKDTISISHNARLEPGFRSPRSRSSRASSGESSMSFLENERNDHERRYLGDATMAAINSTRLRSRYGIVPSTSFTATYDDEVTDVDLNYVPKREYNWRKNFKLDEENSAEPSNHQMQYLDLDSRKLSLLSGDSITIFSRSPEHSEDEYELQKVTEAVEDIEEQLEEEMEQEPEEVVGEKPQKKKNKRKSRKNSKDSGNGREVDSGSRRSSIVIENDLPKKKSRRESKSLISAVLEMKEAEASKKEPEVDEEQPKKKSKKKKKGKQETTLPRLDIKLPSPEKKPAPPSVAALRAALLSAKPVEEKPSLSPSKKSPKIETNSPVSPKPLETPELKPSTQSVLSSSVLPNLEPHRSKSKTPALPQAPVSYPSPNQPNNTDIKTTSAPEPTIESDSLRSTIPNLPHLSTSSHPTNANPPNESEIKATKASPKPVPPKSDAYDIIKDGGLYPLF